MTSSTNHRVVIVGGGAAGISVAARLARKTDDIAIIDPADKHWYQAYFTLVGGGAAPLEKAERSQASVMPKKATWIKETVVSFDPDNNQLTTDQGRTVGYEVLVVCPGIQLDWGKIPGVEDTLGSDGVSSNYLPHLAPKTWEFIQNTKSGTAVFTMPSGPIKCAGAPQKIAYLAADHWRKEGVLDNIDVHLVLPTPGMFGVPVFSKELAKVAEGYGIQVHFEAELASVDPSSRKAEFKSMKEGEAGFSLPYDMMHVVPHQSAPDWIKASPLSNDTPAGYVDIDQYSMQHVKYPNVFALGDAGSSPNSKTGAAARKQAPVVAKNVLAKLDGKQLDAQYKGYASCPLTTAYGKMLLAEFDYTLEHTPSFPIIDLTKPRSDMWLLKKYGLPFLYWNFMMRGML
ncbi:MAG: FAD/NAD(P)-binding oxidoreductase [Acidimicrobiales bacterium]